MPVDPNASNVNVQAVKAELRRDPATYAALSDADAAAAIVWQYKVIRQTPITFKTITAIWGLARAGEFFTALQAATASNATANLIFHLLNSTEGVDASNDQVQAGVEFLVSATLCSQDEVDAVLYERIDEPFGGQPQASDVNAARAIMAVEDAAQAKFDAGLAKWNAFNEAWQLWKRGAFFGPGPADL